MPDGWWIEQGPGWKPEPMTEQYFATWLACECQEDGPTQRAYAWKLAEMQARMDSYGGEMGNYQVRAPQTWEEVAAHEPTDAYEGEG